MGSSHSSIEIPPKGCEMCDVHTLTEYDTIKGKNFEYYNGTRFFKVSRKHYRRYTRGYLYGYYEDPE